MKLPDAKEINILSAMKTLLSAPDQLKLAAAYAAVTDQTVVESVIEISINFANKLDAGQDPQEAIEQVFLDVGIETQQESDDIGNVEEATGT